MPESRPDEPRFALLPWLVHALTAGGAVLALLALVAVESGDWHRALFWLAVALAVDSVDGWLARRLRVKERAPRLDGATLDLIVDYLTYVFVPTLFIWRAGLVPEAVALPLAALIQLSALYSFARADLKTEDNYFRGFPALWNLVAFYLFVTQAPPQAGALLVGLLVLLSFAPVHFVHPFRVADYGRLLPSLALAWAASSGALLWTGWGAQARVALLAASSATAAALIGLGLLRTLRGPARRGRR